MCIKKYIKMIPFINKISFYSICILLIISCSKKPEAVDVQYPPPVIYLSQAAVAKYTGNGVYVVNPNLYNQTVNFKIEGARVIIPVGLIRSGINLSGNVTVNITAAGTTGNNYDALPSNAYTLPVSAIMQDGANNAQFSLSIDENYLINNYLNNAGKQFGLTINIAAPNAQATDLTSVLFIINPEKIVAPQADFFASTYNDGTKTGTFINKSANATSYSWDFGDGSAVVTGANPPPHKYASAGTYTITLTAKGAHDGVPSSVKTSTLTIL